MRSRRSLSLVTTIALALLLVGNATAPAAETTYPNTADGAKALAAEFTKPGADWKSLTQKLRPTEADYGAVFSPALAGKVRAMYEPAWTAGALAVSPKEGQTEVRIEGVPTSEIRQWSPKAAALLPGGYKQIAADLKEGNTIYAFKFVKPGEQLGMTFDGLVFVNGHWCIMPKPWRAMAQAPTDAAPAK